MVDLRALSIALAVIIVVAALLSSFTDLGFWPGFAIGTVALVLNGIVIAVEDDLPGGLNNLDGTATPAYVSKLRSATWIGLLTLAAALLAATWVLERVG